MTQKGLYKWLSVVPALCAVEVRLLGVALFVPIAFLVWEAAAKRPRILIPVCGTVVGCAAVGLWAGRQYFASDLFLLRQEGLGHFVWLAGVTHCEDLGQLAINLPWTKLPSWTAVLIISTGAIASPAVHYGSDRAVQIVCAAGMVPRRVQRVDAAMAVHRPTFLASSNAICGGGDLQRDHSIC